MPVPWLVEAACVEFGQGFWAMASMKQFVCSRVREWEIEVAMLLRTSPTASADNVCSRRWMAYNATLAEE